MTAAQTPTPGEDDISDIVTQLRRGCDRNDRQDYDRFYDLAEEAADQIATLRKELKSRQSTPTPPATQTVGEGEIEAGPIHKEAASMFLFWPTKVADLLAIDSKETYDKAINELAGFIARWEAKGKAKAELGALSRAPADGEWQPIETAPTGGDDFFLVCCADPADERSPFVVRGSIFKTARTHPVSHHLSMAHLTHWMQLPAKPGQRPASPTPPVSTADGELVKALEFVVEHDRAYVMPSESLDKTRILEHERGRNVLYLGAMGVRARAALAKAKGGGE